MPHTLALRAFLLNETALIQRQLEFWPHLHATSDRSTPPLARPAFNQITFEFGKAAQDRQHEAAVRRRRVRPCVAQGSKASANVIELIEDRQELKGAPGEPIKARDQKRIAGRGRGQRLRQGAPVGTCATNLFLENFGRACGGEGRHLRIK
jgi:hypothetical protein